MCSAIPVLVLWVDITVAVWYSSYADVRLSRERNQLHRQYGERAEARVVKLLRHNTNDGFGGHTAKMTLVYCVPMPQPRYVTTAKVQYLKVTKDVDLIVLVQITKDVGWLDLQEGATVTISHLLKHTGDACNSVPVAAVDAPQSVGCCLTFFLALFGGLPLLMGIAACGATGLLPLLSIFVVLPICNACCTAGCNRRQGAYSGGRVDGVNEQEKETAMAWPRVQQVLNPTATPTATPIEKKVSLPSSSEEESEDG